MRTIGWAATWIVLFAVALVFLATGCEPQTSNDGSGRGVSGGRVTVTHDSAASVIVMDGWPEGKTQKVKPGKSSTFKDTDGFCSPTELKTRYVITWALLGRKTGTLARGRCMKISNIETATVTVMNK